VRGFFDPVRLDRGDLVAGVALVDVDERAQSDSGQFADPDRADPANFTARRQGGLWMRYWHIEQSLKQQTTSARLALDCNLIMEIESVRILGFPCYFVIRIHLLPPNRLWPGIQTTYCEVHTRNASAWSQVNSTGSSPSGLQFARRVQNVFQQRSRHIDAVSAGGIGCLRVPSITRRQIQH
jgi:hypothetical protein